MFVPLMVLLFSCGLGDSDPDIEIPAGSFAIRFANKSDSDYQFAVGTATDNLAAESGVIGRLGVKQRPSAEYRNAGGFLYV